MPAERDGFLRGATGGIVCPLEGCMFDSRFGADGLTVSDGNNCWLFELSGTEIVIFF